MSEPSPTNGRATIARLDEKLDNVTAMLEENKGEHREFRRVLGKISTANAVNEERWKNHHDLHKRERGILGALSVISSAVSGTVSAWWSGR